MNTSGVWEDDDNLKDDVDDSSKRREPQKGPPARPGETLSFSPPPRRPAPQDKPTRPPTTAQLASVQRKSLNDDDVPQPQQPPQRVKPSVAFTVPLDEVNRHNSVSGKGFLRANSGRGGGKGAPVGTESATPSATATATPATTASRSRAASATSSSAKPPAHIRDHAHSQPAVNTQKLQSTSTALTRRHTSPPASDRERAPSAPADEDAAYGFFEGKVVIPLREQDRTASISEVAMSVAGDADLLAMLDLSCLRRRDEDVRELEREFGVVVPDLAWMDDEAEDEEDDDRGEADGTSSERFGVLGIGGPSVDRTRTTWEGSMASSVVDAAAMDEELRRIVTEIRAQSGEEDEELKRKRRSSEKGVVGRQTSEWTMMGEDEIVMDGEDGPRAGSSGGGRTRETSAGVEGFSGGAHTREGSTTERASSVVGP
ncbi:hypothetical protein HK101_003761, partial [Irineochytrium annulatum]